MVVTEAVSSDRQLWGKTALEHDQEARRWRAKATTEHTRNPFSNLDNYILPRSHKRDRFNKSVVERVHGGQEHSGFPPQSQSVGDLEHLYASAEEQSWSRFLRTFWGRSGDVPPPPAVGRRGRCF